MKRISVFICVYLWLIFCFSVSAQDYQKIADGIEHAKLVRPMKSADGKPETAVINLLRLDLTKVRLDVVHAMDSAIGLEKTSSIAARHGAIAAINAGFFRIDRSIFEGDDVSILQIDGKLLSESLNNRIALGIINGKERTEINFGHLKTDLSISMGIGSTLSLSGINRERKEKEIILFTPEFSRTTLTTTAGTEFVVSGSSKISKLGNVIEIREKKGSAFIPSDGFVISASSERQEELSHFFKKPMKTVRWNVKINSLEKEEQIFFAKAEDIVSGAPQLIKNGVIEITWQQEKQGKAFVETHHPRTAVAKLKDGKFLMVTVDGRSEESGGISLPDLAAFLLEMGATDAINLDGGGSTTMFVDGKVVNKPSDKEGERKVSDAVLVFPRKKN